MTGICQRILKMTICPKGEEHLTIKSNSIGRDGSYYGWLDVLLVQKIFRGGAGKIHSLKYHFQMSGTGYSYHPALFL